LRSIKIVPALKAAARFRGIAHIYLGEFTETSLRATVDKQPPSEVRAFNESDVWRYGFQPPSNAFKQRVTSEQKITAQGTYP
jgi:hypothetical protein